MAQAYYPSYHYFHQMHSLGPMHWTDLGVHVIDSFVIEWTVNHLVVYVAQIEAAYEKTYKKITEISKSAELHRIQGKQWCTSNFLLMYNYCVDNNPPFDSLENNTNFPLSCCCWYYCCCGCYCCCCGCYCSISNANRNVSYTICVDHQMALSIGSSDSFGIERVADHIVTGRPCPSADHCVAATFAIGATETAFVPFASAVAVVVVATIVDSRYRSYIRRWINETSWQHVRKQA